VAKAGTDAAGAVTRAMQKAPIHDVFTDKGMVRADGCVLYDRYLVRVKESSESKCPWDYGPSSPRFPPRRLSARPALATVRSACREPGQARAGTARRQDRASHGRDDRPLRPSLLK